MKDAMAAFLLFLFPARAALPAEPAEAGAPEPSRRIELSGPWEMQSSFLEAAGGAEISKPDFVPRGWHSVRVPTTVLSALIKAGVYPDLRIGLNAYCIPDASEEFNALHDLSRFSHLPGGRNPWRDPWWFRREFPLPELPSGRRAWLHLDAINYRAEVWMNGTLVAGEREVAGMFRRFRFDITARVRPGKNALALAIYPLDHPGTPDTQWEVLGKDRGYVGKATMRNVTEIVTIGYDCMMTVPDRNMGIWQDARIDFTGPVDLRDPFVATELPLPESSPADITLPESSPAEFPLPETSRATLKISAELANASAEPVKGLLRGEIAGTEVRFLQPVALGPGESKVVAVDPPPVLRSPRLWWPRGYGDQALYDLELAFEAGGTVSAAARVSFGVRQVGSEMHEIEGWHGRRVLVNGQRIFCRGGYIQPELLFDWDARRMETEIRCYAEANLNLIYFEDIPNPPAPFLDLCDRHGILFGGCFYSCYWLRPGTPFPDDLPLLERCTIDIIKRYRNHPSLLFYMAMNESDTKEEVYRMWRSHLLALDGTRWFIPSASFPSGRKDVPEWIQPDLPAGMTDIGASYSWAEPEQYFRWVREKRNWMFMMEGGSASLPPISSLARFLPEVTAPAGPRGERYPLDKDWAHHGANHYFKGYDDALRRLHGEPESVADYCWKGHLVTADQHRSFFEAANHRVWDITSGATQWKINACEPSVQWQIFDWYGKPMVSWFFIKRACEPLHVQFDPIDRTVAAINLRLAPAPDLEVRARAFDLGGRPIWEKADRASVPANSFRDLFAVPEPPGAGPVYFLKLEMQGGQGRTVSESFYWLRSEGTGDLKALASLPPVSLAASLEVAARDGGKAALVKVSNPTDRPAFFVQLALVDRPGGSEILPVFWDDNYFSLLPGESREIAASLPADAAGEPVLEVGGWNVEAPYRCAGLEVPPGGAASGKPFDVSAKIADTFLDGSRVALLLDGKPCGYRRAWARGGRTETVQFRIQIDGPGKHRIALGGESREFEVR